jgi:hypothetical protein
MNKTTESNIYLDQEDSVNTPLQDTTSIKSTKKNSNKQIIKDILLELEAVIGECLEHSTENNNTSNTIINNSPIVKAFFNVSVPSNAGLDKYGNIGKAALDDYPETLSGNPIAINLGENR